MEMTTVETLTLARFGKALFNTSFFTPNGQSLLGMTRQALLSANNNCRFFVSGIRDSRIEIELVSSGILCNKLFTAGQPIGNFLN